MQVESREEKAGYSVLTFSFGVSESIGCSPREDAEPDGPVLTVPLFLVLLGWFPTLIDGQKGTQSPVTLAFLPFAPSFVFSSFLSPFLSSFFFFLYALWFWVPLPPFLAMSILLSEHHAMGQVGLFSGACVEL